MEAPAGFEFRHTIHESLGIRAVEIERDRIVLELDVGPQVHQPFGLLHGGASATLAESCASLGGWLNCDPERESVVGVDLNITHLRARRSGTVTATGTPIRKGRKVHVWGVELRDEDDEMVAVARVTLMVLDGAGR